MGGGGGGGQKKAADNGSNQWKKELEMQERWQREQLAAQERALNAQREQEAAARAREEQARKDALQQAQDKEAISAANAGAQSGAQQAAGGDINAAIAQRVSSAGTSSAPGLSPFGAAVKASSAPVNQFYSPTGTRLGGA